MPINSSSGLILASLSNPGFIGRAAANKCKIFAKNKKNPTVLLKIIFLMFLPNGTKKFPKIYFSIAFYREIHQFISLLPLHIFQQVFLMFVE